jgi:branched-chain amino acid transport system substrate-binding protein
MPVLLATVLAVAAVAAIMATAASGRSAAGTPIKIAILTDCKGAFGAFYDDDIAGALAPFIQFAGAKAKNPKKPSAGISGGQIGGHPIQIVGYGCGSDQADLAIKETKRLMEQLGGQILIGPLSGDEAIAVAHYAQAHPTKTFINGTAASQDPTLQIAPKNFFRYNGDGAQWNAGIGDLAYRKLHWRKAAIIMDDYSFAWTSAAGMIADFCAVGGKIVKRVFPPLNTTDYSSFARQLPAPDKVDGYFWVVGGTGTVPSLKAFETAYGPLSASKVIGNLFFEVTGNFEQIAPHVSGAYAGGFGTPGGDYHSAAANAYYKSQGKIWKQIPPLGAASAQFGGGFYYNYYKAGWALEKALETVHGNIATQKPLQAALAKVKLAGAFGLVVLDKNRQAIEDEWSYQIIAKPGQTLVKTVQWIPKVTQTFGGTFGAHKPPPSRSFPPCVKRSLPWSGKEKPVVNGVIKK